MRQPSPMGWAMLRRPFGPKSSESLPKNGESLIDDDGAPIDDDAVPKEDNECLKDDDEAPIDDHKAPIDDGGNADEGILNRPCSKLSAKNSKMSSARCAG